MFIGVDLLLHRWFGAGSSKALLLMLYFALCAAVTIPGILVAVFLYSSLFLPLSLCILAMAGTEVLVSLLLLFFSRNILSASECNNT